MTALQPHPQRVERALAVSVIDAAMLMATLRLVTGTVGNLSARLGDQFLVTPTRRHYDEISPEDLVRINLEAADGSEQVSTASREWRLHAAVYRARPDVSAIAHTHSPYAVARSFQRQPLMFWTEEAVYLDLPTVPVVPYAAGGSTELAESAAQMLGSGRGLLLERHGVVAVSSTPRDAVDLAAAIEHQAHVQWLLMNASPAATYP